MCSLEIQRANTEQANEKQTKKLQFTSQGLFVVIMFRTFIFIHLFIVVFAVRYIPRNKRERCMETADDRSIPSQLVIYLFIHIFFSSFVHRMWNTYFNLTFFFSLSIQHNGKFDLVSGICRCHESITYYVVSHFDAPSLAHFCSMLNAHANSKCKPCGVCLQSQNN